MRTPSPQRHAISAFFPAYNDAGTIGKLVTDTLQVLSALADDYEVVVVDDGSVDGTSKLLDDLAKVEPRLVVIHHGENRGVGAALRTGFNAATKELVFYTDGDAQYDVAELPRLVALMDVGVDAVNGYREQRADDRVRIVLGTIYGWLARVLFRLPIRDVECAFRLMRRSALDSISLESSGGVLDIELIRKLHLAGCTFAETLVHHFPRTYGRSQFFTIRRVARLAFDFGTLWLTLVPLRWLRRTTKP
ncbi:MAG TPA: glycosyltransferase family 2 protein [Actinomycetota bacterium]|nr:glycosyltransferase family 2 protein [Actinomycetota bacterium]